MSKVTMPEPVAWRYTDAKGHYRYRGYVARFDSLYPILRPEALITTDQAEAYADAKVREIIDSVLDALVDCHIDNGQIEEISSKVSALIK